MLEQVWVSKELDPEPQSVWLATSLQLMLEISARVDPRLAASQTVTEFQTKIVHLHYSQHITHLREEGRERGRGGGGRGGERCG